MKALFMIFVIQLLALSAVSAANNCDSSVDGYTYPNPSDCEYFFLCISNTPEVRKCQFGLHYSPTKNYCQKPSDAGCEPVSSTDCTSLSDGDTIPNLNDCSKFFMCDKQQPVEKNCKSGLHYNAKKKYCVEPKLSECVPVSSIPDCKNLNNGEMFEKKGDCEKFYLCDKNLAVEKSCKPGLHFNPIKKYCQDPKLAGCSTSPEPTPPGPTPPGPTPPGPTPPGPTPPGKPNFEQLCKGHPLGRLIRYCFDLDCKTGDCTKYINCIGGGVEMKCAKGTHFNEKKQTCDWPQSVNCPWA